MPISCISSAAPSNANAACALACSRRSASTLAVAMPAGTRQNVSRRAPTISPPTFATGSTTLMASRIQRSNKQTRVGTGVTPPNRYAQAVPFSATMEARTNTTAASPQPTAAKARSTAPALLTAKSQPASARPSAMQTKMPAVTIALAVNSHAPGPDRGNEGDRVAHPALSEHPGPPAVTIQRSKGAALAIGESGTNNRDRSRACD